MLHQRRNRVRGQLFAQTPASINNGYVSDAGKSRPNLFRYTLKGVEELDHFPSEESRLRALDEIGSEVRLRDLAIGITILAAVVFITASGARMLIRWLIPGVLGSADKDVSLLCGVIVGVVVMRWLHRWGTAKSLRRKLLKCGVAVCVQCGYLLRGLPINADTCPECGATISAEARLVMQPFSNQQQDAEQ